jgi:predicted neuraminidase
LSLSPGAVGRPASGSLLCVLSRLRPQGVVCAPNGARRRTQPPAPRAATTLTRGWRAPLVILAALAHASVALGQPRLAVVRSELVFQNATFAMAHASTIAETPTGLVVAWFGGSFEGSPDVAIWVSRLVAGRWSPPEEAANGAQPEGTRLPCWNPVLYQPPNGPLMLFYKVGPNPREWWGMVTTSANGGRTWTPPRRLPDGILGPIKNKPVRLRDGTLVSPSSTESGDARPIWRVHFERSTDGGKTWTRVAPASRGPAEVNAIQPTILVRGDSLTALVRTQSRHVYATWSADGGKTWSALSEVGLPNPNAGIDGITLRDGRHLLVYNNSATARTPLTIGLSDDARAWTPVLALETEPGEYSYPAVIQTNDGLVHITYTWKRLRIKHVVVDPRKLR